mmetsp:Transcript_61634/g.182109  ORF Transcript_61634/g.182109 Transcript_61634/m.182109 type:complete len:245 (-) Transcript_61634:33-767(-)
MASLPTDELLFRSFSSFTVPSDSSLGRRRLLRDFLCFLDVVVSTSSKTMLAFAVSRELFPFSFIRDFGSFFAIVRSAAFVLLESVEVSFEFKSIFTPREAGESTGEGTWQRLFRTLRFLERDKPRRLLSLPPFSSARVSRMEYCASPLSTTPQGGSLFDGIGRIGVDCLLFFLLLARALSTAVVVVGAPSGVGGSGRDSMSKVEDDKLSPLRNAFDGGDEDVSCEAVSPRYSVPVCFASDEHSP